MIQKILAQVLLEIIKNYWFLFMFYNFISIFVRPEDGEINNQNVGFLKKIVFFKHTLTQQRKLAIIKQVIKIYQLLVMLIVFLYIF